MLLQFRRRDRRRLQASFRRGTSYPFWRLGFRQSSFRHITRISRRAAPYAWARPPVSWHAIVPFAFRLLGQPLDPEILVRPGESGGRYVCELLASLPDSSA